MATVEETKRLMEQLLREGREVHLSTCALPGCQRTFPQNPRGRRRLFCGAPHRQAASAKSIALQRKMARERPQMELIV